MGTRRGDTRAGDQLKTALGQPPLWDAVARFLSKEWLDDLNEVLKSLDGVEGLNVPLVIQHLIERPDEEQASFYVTIGVQGASASFGVNPGASVVYRHGFEVAEGIVEGKRDPHEEFLLGRLVFSGDPMHLLTHGETLRALQECIRSHRAETAN